MLDSRVTRILIVDDHPVVREGMKTLIGTQPDMTVAGEAENLLQAKVLFPLLSPDVTLLDLRLPDAAGALAVIELERAFPGANIVVVSSFADQPEVQACMAAGVNAYLLKDAPRAELFAAIRHAADGAAFVSRHTLDALRQNQAEAGSSGGSECT